jgi:hypothetical protein
MLNMEGADLAEKVKGELSRVRDQVRQLHGEKDIRLSDRYSLVKMKN